MRLPTCRIVSMSFMKNCLFDECQQLKVYYDALLVQLLENDKNVKELKDYKKNLELEVNLL